MRLTKAFLRLSLFVLTFAVLATIGRPSLSSDEKTNGGQTSDPNGVLLLSLGGDISTLNPILTTDTSSSSVSGLIFSGLVRINEKLEPIPDLAESWQVLSGGRVWRFKLRRGVKWHDGKPFTARDVIFTFQKILDPKTNTVRRSDYVIDDVPIVTRAIGVFEVEFKLPKPFAPFLVNMGIGILPEHLYRKEDVNTSPWNFKPIGTGPFKFVEWKSGEYARVVRNDDFYFGVPKLAGVIFKVIPDENTRMVALETGEIDETNIPPKDYARMKKVKGLQMFEYDALTYTYLGFNLKSPIFQDVRVRRALAYATNKGELVQKIYRGLASAAYAPSAPASWAYSNNVEKYPFDPVKSRKLLEEAGWRLGGDGYYERDGKRLEFTILTNQGNKEREKGAIVLQSQFKKIGVKANIRIMEWSALLKIINAPKDPKDFDAVVIGWSLGVDPDDFSIWHSSQYPRGFNFIAYKNSEVDRWIEDGRTTMDKNRRKKIYSRVYRQISEDQPYIFLWYPKAIVAVRERVGGLSQPGPAGLMVYMEKVFVSH